MLTNYINTAAKNTQIIRASIPCHKSQRPHKMQPCFTCTLPTLHVVPVVFITWLPPSFTHPTIFITLQQHVTGRWERGRATPQLRLRTSTVLIFRRCLLMVILKVSLLQIRLWLWHDDTYSSYCHGVSLCVWYAVHSSPRNQCYKCVAVVALNC